jgi:hypothetical protein
VVVEQDLGCLEKYCLSQGLCHVRTLPSARLSTNGVQITMKEA